MSDISLEEGLRSMIAWYESSPETCAIDQVSWELEENLCAAYERFKADIATFAVKKPFTGSHPKT